MVVLGYEGEKGKEGGVPGNRSPAIMKESKPLQQGSHAIWMLLFSASLSSHTLPELHSFSCHVPSVICSSLLEHTSVILVIRNWGQRPPFPTRYLLTCQASELLLLWIYLSGVLCVCCLYYGLSFLLLHTILWPELFLRNCSSLNIDRTNPVA